MTTEPPVPGSDASRKGWTVVVALFVMLGIGVTARNSIGLMMPVWKNDLGWSYGFVSGTGAVMLTVMALIAPIGGMALDRFGPRWVFTVGMSLVGVAFVLCSMMTETWQLMVLFGIIGGAGFAVISPSLVSATVVRYFDSRIGLATSIATSGSTGGQLALMPLLGLLVAGIGWRPSFVAVAVAVAAATVAVQFVIKDDPKRRRAAAGARIDTIGVTLRRLANDKTFWLLAVGFFICGFTTAGVIKIHLIPYAVSCGFAPLQSAAAYGVLSLFSMIGMIVYGHLSDRFHRPMLLASIYLLRALTFILLMQIAGSVPALYIFAVLFGIFDYSTFPLVASLVATHIGRHIMGVTMGLMFAGHSLGAAVGSFMGGYMFDLSARYDWVWIVSVGLAVTAGLLSLLIVENRPGVAAPAPA
jgi:MFS family permease